ncbi:hypothetical protein ACFTY8_22440 [Streptomyces mirabilis]|uniref:hypothetical protein n=1 Tax=Streptomyces mirabilis TaxID=68239 RepID=UPI0036272053
MTQEVDAPSGIRDWSAAMRLRMPRPFVVDSLIALAVTGVAMLLGHVSRATQGRPEPYGRAHVLIALAHLPVTLRGRWPLGGDSGPASTSTCTERPASPAS